MKPRIRLTLSWRPILHIGLARTALLANLLSEAFHGQVVVRLDNVHNSTSLPDVIPIIEGLKWLSIDWNEGLGKPGPYEPYYTSGRLELYMKYAYQLWKSGNAYVCDCPEASPDNKTGYNGKCRKRCLPFNAGALRFKVNNFDTTEIKDVVRGKLVLSNRGLTDPIIVRTNGSPTLYLTNAVDDMHMGVDFTIWERTPRMTQIITQVASKLKLPPPSFIHISQIYTTLPSHGGKKLTSPFENSYLGFDIANTDCYRNAGYSANTIVSLLLLTIYGGPFPGHPDTLSTVVRRFSLKYIRTSPVVLPLNEINAIERYWRRRETSTTQLL